MVLKGNLLAPSFNIEKIGPNDTVLVFFHQPCAVSNEMTRIKSPDEQSVAPSDTTESIGQMLLTRITPHTPFKNLISEENPGFLPIPDELDYVDVFRYATEDSIDPLIQIDQLNID